MTADEPLFFTEPALWRAWLAKHHDTENEVWVGFRKTATGRPSITWPQSVDEALCFGWIDGVRKRIDETSYKIRFTPRKRRSTWSAVNIKRMKELTDLGLVEPAGRKAFELRTDDNSSIYSYENRPAELPAAYEQQFRADAKAWDFFSAQSPSYRRLCIWWVVSAKQETTRVRRLATLIADSRAGEKSASFRQPGGAATN
jgi:uncharacterized protein YdeI (YjbR/CyaY-like superfamily)